MLDSDTFEGEYKFENGERKGRWKHAYQSGSIKSERVLDGEVDTCVEYYENGKIKKMTRYVERLEEGEWLHYHENGNLKFSHYYEQGKACRVWSEFYENATPKSTSTYINGILCGSFSAYHPNGKLCQNGEFVDNKKDGKWDGFDDKGNLSESSFYARGKEEGAFKAYYDSGRVCRSGAFKNGQKSGSWQHYDEKGRLVSEEVFVNNELDGACMYFNQKGILESEKVYSKGILLNHKEFLQHGLMFVAEFYADGTLKAEGKMQHIGGSWVLDDTWKEYDEKGFLSCEKHYQDGYVEGVSTGFFKNGKPCSIVSYREGKVDGLVRRFLADGTIGYEGIYSKGIEIERRNAAQSPFLTLPAKKDMWFEKILSCLTFSGSGRLRAS